MGIHVPWWSKPFWDPILGDSVNSPPIFRLHFGGWIESEVHWGLTDLEFDKPVAMWFPGFFFFCFAAGSPFWVWDPMLISGFGMSVNKQMHVATQKSDGAHRSPAVRANCQGSFKRYQKGIPKSRRGRVDTLAFWGDGSRAGQVSQKASKVPRVKNRYPKLNPDKLLWTKMRPGLI